MSKKIAITLDSACIALAIATVIIFVNYSSILNDKDVTILNLQNQKDTINTELSVLQEEMQSLQEQMDSQKSEADILTANLQNEVGTLEDEKNNLQNEVNTLTGDKTKLQNQVATLESEKNNLQNEVNTLTIEKNTLQNQVDSLESEKTNLQNQLNTLESEYQDYRSAHTYSNSDYWDYVYDHLFTNEEYEEASFSFYYVKPEQQYGVYSLEDEISTLTWIRDYEEDVFDCSEMSAYLEWHLENEGWNTVILVGDSPFSTGRHAWLLVETTEGAYMPVESTNVEIVWWSDPNFDNYFAYDYSFENIQEALDYLETEFDWWN